MADLRDGLGDYVPKDKNKPLPKDGLTLHDLGELIRRAGQKARFIVESEYKVLRRGRHPMKIDWVWLSPKTLQPIVAVEIEGPAAPRKSVKGDIDKFQRCKAPLYIIAIFQVDHDRSLKPKPAHDLLSKALQNAKENPRLKVVFDEGLMAREQGGIEELVRQAREEAGI